MNLPGRQMSVAVISRLVGRTPDDITYSFIFSEIYRLANKGVNVHVVRSETEEDSFSSGICFHGLKKKIDALSIGLSLREIFTYPPIFLLRKPTTIYRDSLYAMNVSKVMKANDITLIHAHFAFPEGLVGLLASKRLKKPLVVTVHGYDILVEPSVGYGVRLSRRINAVVCKVLNDADAVIAKSEATFNEAKKIIDDVKKLHLIPYGVDIQKFNPNLDGSSVRKKWGIKERTVVFALRNHEPKNGLEYLIRAAPIVTKEEESVVFVIGGDGTLRQYHEQLAVKLGVKENIVFTGKISPSETPFYFAMCDVAVVPSLQEAFGLVVSEAMACGRPVVGTLVGGIPDQIVDGYNGFLVQPKDPVEIANKILWLICNPEKARDMGMNGRRIVEAKFDINKNVDRVISLYGHLLPIAPSNL